MRGPGSAWIEFNEAAAGRAGPRGSFSREKYLINATGTPGTTATAVYISAIAPRTCKDIG
jgi:hypothetical protein